jgi:hypothetical protein
MNYKHFGGIFYFVFAFFVFWGCRTSEPIVKEVVKEVTKEIRKEVEVIDTRMPLTLAILQRLDNYREDINKFQLINLGRISLEREYTEPNDTIETGGKIRFEDVHIREVVVVQDQTYSQALKIEEVDDEMVLSVCFEESSDNTLNFSVKKDNLDGYFYLKTDKNERILLYGEEKGSVEYMGKQYKVKYSGEKEPYLLIKLSQKDIDKIDSYTMKGRRVN